MGKYYSGNNADEIYEKIYWNVKNNSNHIINGRKGKTKEELHMMFSITDPRQRWVTCRKPVISPALAFAELITIMNGCAEAKIINKWNPVLPQYQGNYEEYPGAYGKRLRHIFGFDQLEKAYETLKYNSNSRQVVLDIWKPDIDLPKHDGVANNDDIPCNICSMLKIRNGKLYWTQVMRSNDIFLGLPYNILQFTSLQEIFAGWLDIEVGEYMHISDSMHFYVNNEMQLQNKILSKNTDNLKLDKRLSEKVFLELFKKMKELGSDNLDDSRIYEILQSKTLPEAYYNMLRILCAYAARKRKNYDLVRNCIEQCSNSLYVDLWRKWNVKC